MNRNQFEISTDTRREDIINYIINHQGSTRADFERGLRNRMAKKTIDKLVPILIAEHIIQEERDKPNSKKHKLFVSENNLLVSVPRQLEQFESAFFSLFDITTEKVTVPSIFGEFPGKPSDTLTSVTKRIIELSEYRLALILRMVDYILIRAILEWPKRIQDEKDLNRLYQTVFSKIANLLSRISEKHEIPRLQMEYSTQTLVLEKLGGVGSLFESWKKFKDYGVQKEVEKVIDILWNIDREIHEMMCKDGSRTQLDYVSMKLGFNFNYESNNWRELFEALDSLDKQKRN